MTRRRTWRGRKSSRGYSRYNYGHEAARKHIAAAAQLSAQLGGMDKEVKAFFFSLPPDRLTILLSQYGLLHGDEAKSYAVSAFPKWKSGKTQMSGLVAERLFALLPPLMPLDLKMRIVEGLWEQQGVKRTDYLLVPTSMSAQEVLAYVRENLFSYITEQSIPDDIKRRFKWLSGDDARVAEQLFRHVRGIQVRTKELISSSILELVEKTAVQNSDVIHQAVTTVDVAKHSVSIKRSEWVQSPIVVGQSAFLRGNKPPPTWLESVFSSDSGWFWWLFVAILILLYIFSRKS